MKGKLLTFLVLPAVIFSASLIFFAIKVSAQTISDGSTCVATSCGTTTGTKQEPITEEVCDEGCPTVTFTAERQVVDVAGHYGNCIDGYTVDPQHANRCIKTVTNTMYAVGVWHSNHWNCPSQDSDYTYTSWNSSLHCSRNITSILTMDRPWIATTYTTETFGPISVQYGIRAVPSTHCHRPNVEDLDIPNWARNDYNNQITEHLQTTSVNCRQEPTGEYTSEVCYDATIIPCEVPCEWNEAIDSDDPSCVAPTVCEYDETLTADDPSCIAPTVCEYDETLTADDPSCVAPTVCQYNGALLASDPLCVDSGEVEGVTDDTTEDDKGDVLGVTDVVTADTAGGISEYAYILQTILVLITSTLFVAASKEYLKK